ncbi:TEL1, partial [Acrasis kona]
VNNSSPLLNNNSQSSVGRLPGNSFDFSAPFTFTHTPPLIQQQTAPIPPTPQTTLPPLIPQQTTPQPPAPSSFTQQQSNAATPPVVNSHITPQQQPIQQTSQSTFSEHQEFMEFKRMKRLYSDTTEMGFSDFEEARAHPSLRMLSNLVGSTPKLQEDTAEQITKKFRRFYDIPYDKRFNALNILDPDLRTKCEKGPLLPNSETRSTQYNQPATSSLKTKIGKVYIPEDRIGVAASAIEECYNQLQTIGRLSESLLQSIEGYSADEGVSPFNNTEYLEAAMQQVAVRSALTSIFTIFKKIDYKNAMSEVNVSDGGFYTNINNTLNAAERRAVVEQVIQNIETPNLNRHNQEYYDRSSFRGRGTRGRGYYNGDRGSYRGGFQGRGGGNPRGRGYGGRGRGNRGRGSNNEQPAATSTGSIYCLSNQNTHGMHFPHFSKPHFQRHFLHV